MLRVEKENANSLSGRSEGEGSSSNKKEIEATSYRFHELAAATDNFRVGNLIGEGGFGSVYKGRLESGQVSFASIKFRLFDDNIFSSVIYYVLYVSDCALTHLSSVPLSRSLK